MLLEKATRIDRRFLANKAHRLVWSPVGMPRTPLGAAIMNGHEKATELLLQSGAPVHVSDFEGATPLSLAVETQKIRLVQLLLEHGADIEEPGLHGKTPLCCAVSSTNFEMVQLLLDRGADVNRACSNVDGSTPLLFAVKQRNLGVIQLFSRHGVNVEKKDTKGMTPLTFAIKLGDCDSVRALLDAGANVDQIGQYDIAPLLAVLIRPYYCCEWRLAGPRIDLTWRLHQVRWNPHAIAGVSMCASSIQKGRYGPQQVVFAILSRGVQPLSNWLHSDGCGQEQGKPHEFFSPYFDDSGRQSRDAQHTLEITLTELSNERIQIIQQLMRYKANPEARDIGGETLLWMAVCRAYVGLVEKILEYGADVEAADTVYGMSPLWVAALLGFDDIICLLLAKGANIERKCLNGQTPLAVAAEKGCAEAVEVLLGHGASWNVQDALGRTPLEAAMENGHADMTEIFRASETGTLGIEQLFL